MANTTRSIYSWGRVRNGHGLVSRTVIRRLVQRIIKHFDPERIILFGSYAYGRAKPESDVDLLVVMAARNEIDQALRIEETFDPPFSVDIVVRTPKNLQWRMKEGDWFLREVVERGKVLYEKNESGIGAKASPTVVSKKNHKSRSLASSSTIS